ncbi:DMT family transporter [Curvivirga aplysinae]|uniref:DMT family transporter n=1 Tax=Curvivirga aplysinae TaxID=2529852 RepID=UPI0012BC6B62|nr:DMT family transporter [Curvivirga aplysinae]MTI09247.1 DMT family transporter [Curvivirga aplysinae]
MTRWQANLCLLLAAAIWGSTFAVQHVAMDSIGPMAFTAIRFYLGAVVVAPFAWREWNSIKHEAARGERELLSGKDWFGFSLTGACLFAGAYIQQYGIIYTTVTNAGFLTAFYVLLVPVLGVLLFRRKVHWSVWPAGFACIGGTAILSGAYGAYISGTAFELNIGDFWVLVSAFFWAMHVLLVGVYGQRVGKPALFAFVQFLTVGFIGLIFTVATEEVTMAQLTDSAWMLAYAGFISVGIGFTCQVLGQKYTGPADAAIIISMETVFAAMTGMAFLGERLSPIDFVGCALILSAVFLVELTPMLTRGWRKRWMKPVD